MFYIIFICFSVDERILEKKIKMLSLISLAEQSKVLPLSKLASELDITDSDALEQFLIDAIQVKAINVRFFVSC